MRVEYTGWLFEADHLNLTTLVYLAVRANDAGCWAALSAISNVAPPAVRFGMVLRMRPPHPPDWPDPARPARLRFLLSLLDDRSPIDPRKVGEDYREFVGQSTEVRDFAASVLARAFRIRVQPDPRLDAILHND